MFRNLLGQTFCFSWIVKESEFSGLLVGVKDDRPLTSGLNTLCAFGHLYSVYAVQMSQLHTVTSIPRQDRY